MAITNQTKHLFNVLFLVSLITFIYRQKKSNQELQFPPDGCGRIGFDPVENYGYFITLVLYLNQIYQLILFPTLFFVLFGAIFCESFKTKRSRLNAAIDIFKLPKICFRVTTKGSYANLVREVTSKNLMAIESAGLANFSYEVVTATPIGDLCKFVKNAQNEFQKSGENVIQESNQKETQISGQKSTKKGTQNSDQKGTQKSTLKGTQNEVQKRDPKNVVPLEIVVPPTYQTSNGATFKARQLQYGLDINASQLTDQDWIVFLDEETILTRSAVVGIAEFVAKDKHEFGFGLLKFTNEGVGFQSALCWLLDCPRVAFDWFGSRFCLRMLHTPANAIRGAFLVTKMAAAVDVGYDLPPQQCHLEDAYHFFKAAARGYTFDFVDGVCLEMSPFTFRDVVAQRARWILGGFTVHAHGRDFPFFVKWFHWIQAPQNILLPFALAVEILQLWRPLPVSGWWLLFLALRDSVGIYLALFGTFLCVDWKKGAPLGGAVLVLVAPALAILTPIITVLAVFRIFFGNISTFEIVNKDAKSEEEKKTN